MLSEEYRKIEQVLADPNWELHAKARLQVVHDLQLQYYNKILELLINTPSQVAQDIFVLSELNFKRGGYFVEFGASNGISNSNTYMLEKHYGWTGILSEPARCHHQELFANRSCVITTDCVWTTSGQQIEFKQVDGNGELSGITGLAGLDNHNGTVYNVNTISLTDLLLQNNAPNVIDYLSIDTEGSELDILQSFDFDSYKIKIITCEHNWTDKRQVIYDFLTSKGYERRMENVISYAGYPAGCFDDWYVLKDSK
jgi:FkbM family methyltransferase